MKKMTLKLIAINVADIMKRHMGRDNSIPMDMLKWKIFNKKVLQNYDKQVQSDLCLAYGTRLKSALHYLRAHTHCFPVSTKVDGVWSVYIIMTKKQAQEYKDVLDFNAEKMELMKKRADLSVSEKWFEEKWEI